MLDSTNVEERSWVMGGHLNLKLEANNFVLPLKLLDLFLGSSSVELMKWTCD
jgi:hypothetical protein